ncbi:MAG: enoyl-CoA hydratase/isomerase family protein [Acidimicrobiia bacterium]
MTDEPHLLVDRSLGSIAVVSLNRPERLNALTFELVADIASTLRELGRDESCRVIVLTGSGRGFCAGLDLVGAADRNAGTVRGPSTRLDGQENFAAMVQAIRAAKQPVIAAVNGAAAGAGMALTMACDVRILAESAVLHVAAVKIGLSAGECGISYHLPRHIGSGKAFEILLTGRPIGAAEAERIGLVSRVVPDGEVVDAALETAQAICRNSPFAVRMTKEIMWANLDAPSFEHALALENRTQILATLTSDSAEAMQAFVEKRPPTFTGE